MYYLGGEDPGVGSKDRAGSPVSTKKFLDQPATSSCTLGSSAVMVSVTGRWTPQWAEGSTSSVLKWTEQARSVHQTIMRKGLALDLEAVGSQGQCTCPVQLMHL